MNLKKIFAGAMIGGALSFSALGLGGVWRTRNHIQIHRALDMEIGKMGEMGPGTARDTGRT